MTKRVRSKITSWIIKLLLLIIFMICLCLLVLSFLGGNSEYHRQGLEQAFSDTLKSDVTIGTLDHFNIFPQMSLQAENVHGLTRKNKKEFLFDKIVIAFGFSDLIFGKKSIEDFQLDNLRFAKDSNLDLRIDHSGIKKDSGAAFTAQGQFSGRTLNFALPLIMDKNGRGSFRFADNNKFSGHFGAFDFSGSTVTSAGPDGMVMKDISLTQGAKQIAHGQGLRKNGELKIFLACDVRPVPADLIILKNLSFIELDKDCVK